MERRARLLRIFVFGLSNLLLIACAHDGGMPKADRGEGVATLKWQPPTENEQGEPLTDLAEYHVLYGRSPNDLRYSLRVEDESQTTVVVSGLEKGTWYFAIVAVDSQGRSSSPSEIVSKVIR